MLLLSQQTTMRHLCVVAVTTDDIEGLLNQGRGENACDTEACDEANWAFPANAFDNKLLW